jgi:ribosomal protein S18 acetylase RimI-like enzyme
MSSASFQIRRAAPADAPVLAWLGPALFRETFGAEFPPEVIAERMASTYARGRLEVELADPDQAWFLALAGQDPVGFLALREGPAPGFAPDPRAFEISRLYVLAAWHGRGPGFTLMEAGLGEAAERSAGTVWLQAWERNAKALAFYRAHGFRRIGEITVDLAGIVLPHLLLARTMPAARQDP